MKSILWRNDQLILLDQTRLPQETIFLEITEEDQVWEAIKKLQVRGAPAIGIAAAYGLYLAAKGIETSRPSVLYRGILEKSEYLSTARPTAVNLVWALRRLENRALLELRNGANVEEIKASLLNEAFAIQKEDVATCRKIGEYALSLFEDNMGILTHCNPGSLATAGYGTATAPFYLAKEKGWNLRIYADETRPLLQGARLTAWELQQADIDVTLICDSMAATVMAQGKVKAVIVGTDRIAANGDVANKIGTYNLAILARYHGIPFYVAAPLSSIDLGTPDGSQIPIEERSGEEITQLGGQIIAPAGVKTYNPAFDVTPASLVSAIITEEGIILPKEEDGSYDLRGITAFGAPVKVGHNSHLQ